jgi:hypothetical protein
LLPFVLGVVVMANVAGILVTKFGYCKSFHFKYRGVYRAYLANLCLI